MLDSTIKGQLKAYLEKLQRPIELVATTDASAKSQELLSLLDDIATLSDKVSVRKEGDAAYKPSFSVGAPGEAGRIHFAGIPMGHEFTSLVSSRGRHARVPDAGCPLTAQPDFGVGESA